MKRRRLIALISLCTLLAIGLLAVVGGVVLMRTDVPRNFVQELLQSRINGRLYIGRISGTHTEQFFQFAPTGRKVSVMGINEFRMENGRIAERWGIFDVMGMMQQMGVIPSGPGAH